MLLNNYVAALSRDFIHEYPNGYSLSPKWELGIPKVRTRKPKMRTRKPKMGTRNTQSENS